MTYLLDSSAWLVHLFAESGVEQIVELFSLEESKIYISVLSIPEVFGRLKQLGQEDQWPAVWGIYQNLFIEPLPVTERSALTAVQLRKSAVKRIPTIDSLIAATAIENNCILVHRDYHFSYIENSSLGQMLLP